MSAIGERTARVLIAGAAALITASAAAQNEAAESREQLQREHRQEQTDLRLQQDAAGIVSPSAAPIAGTPEIDQRLEQQQRQARQEREAMEQERATRNADPARRRMLREQQQEGFRREAERERGRAQNELRGPIQYPAPVR